MPKVVVLGVFVADTAYRATRAPRMGETIMGESFALGPGGKGSNQAVAAARAGVETHFITRLGRDTFADMALQTWRTGRRDRRRHPAFDSYTGAAYIFVEAGTGDNAIIVCPGVAGQISPADIEARSDLIGSASVFVTQLEQPMDAAMRAWKSPGPAACRPFSTRRPPQTCQRACWRCAIT
jgi:ribokinase